MRKEGIGRLLIKKIFNINKPIKVGTSITNYEAINFYIKLGYKITSEVFTEVTIPHYRMEKELKKNKLLNA